MVLNWIVLGSLVFCKKRWLHHFSLRKRFSDRKRCYFENKIVFMRVFFMIIIFLFQKWELKLIVEIHYQKKVPSFRKLAAVIFHENNSLFLFNSASTGPILYIFGNKASNWTDKKVGWYWTCVRACTVGHWQSTECFGHNTAADDITLRKFQFFHSS